MKILIVDNTHPALMEMLDVNGFECHYRPDITYNEALGCISEYEGLVVRSKFRVENEILDKAINLKFVARAGAGTDNIDEAYAHHKGVKILNAPEGNANAVGEHTLGMLLALLNKIAKADKEVRNGQWKREDNRGLELDGKTIGIIGYGNMGPAFAKKLRGFDVKVLVYDKYKTGFSTEWVKEVSLEKIFQEADILSLHIPLNDETLNMVDEKFLSNFKKDIWFINEARGEIVDIKALLQALKSGKVKGAALDVLPCEKFPLSSDDQIWFEELKSLDNVVLMPHVGGWTVESFEKISVVLAEKICTNFK